MNDDSVPSVAAGRLVRRHREMFCLALVVLVLSGLLEVHADQRVAFCFLPDWPLPESCPSRSMFGLACPGCGLTRSFIYLAHGNWTSAWNVHRVGWILALAVVLQIPYRLFALWTGNYAPLGPSAPRLFGSLLIALLVINWLMQVIALSLN